MGIPKKTEYLIIGAGIHGLSTAWHLAKKLKAKGKGDGSNIIVGDKGSIAINNDEVVEYIIDTYTNEPGVRKLKELLFEIISEINWCHNFFRTSILGPQTRWSASNTFLILSLFKSPSGKKLLP